MGNVEKVYGKESILGTLSNVMADKSIARIDRRTDRINKGFDIMVRCVNVLGHVDDFISDRTRNILQRLHTMYHEDRKHGQKGSEPYSDFSAI